MYKEFFDFSAEPFRVTPDPGFLYLTDQHKEALAAIIYGISKRKGFVCITGEVGVGKTTILRSYLDSVDEAGLRFIYIFNPNVSFQALLKTILKELAVPYDGDDIAGMVETLKHWLLEHHSKRETLVLLIDEAQNMPIGTLENLRMLSNLETATEKLVQIVLVGQPELEQLLAERQLRQLESRIAVRTRLGPLSKQDSANYIRHRLKCVSLGGQPAFTDGAVKEIVARAAGIPRRINVLADNALMNAFGHKVKPVTAKIVAEVVRDMRVKEPAMLPRLVVPWKRVAWGGAAVAAGAAILVFGYTLTGGERAETARMEPRPVALPPPPALPQLPQQMPQMPDIPVRVEATPASVLPEPATTPPPVLPALVPAVEEPARRVVRIVAPGDTLAGLTFEVYGRMDGQVLDWVKTHNREIVNVDRIQVGQVIEFPAMTAQARP